MVVANLKTAAKTLKNKKVKASQRASCGHAAKVFDIAVKVYVHYCHFPSCELAARIRPSASSFENDFFAHAGAPIFGHGSATPILMTGISFEPIWMSKLNPRIHCFL